MLKKQKRIFQNRNNPMFCDVIKKTILSEKSTKQLDNFSAYMFEIQNWANKIIVRNAISNLFNVRVLKVNILNTPGKEKRRKNSTFKTSMRKIAIVYVHPEDVIMLERK